MQWNLNGLSLCKYSLADDDQTNKNAIEIKYLNLLSMFKICKEKSVQ